MSAVAPASCTPGTIGTTQGWIIVDAKFEDKILAEGYICRGRDRVPITRFQAGDGATAMLRWESPDLAVVLEVHGVDESLIDREGARTFINMKHLPAANLRSGQMMDRSADISDTCPFCGKLHAKDSEYARLHRLLGKRYFAGGTELVSPGCCHEEQTQRQKRLEEGQTVMLYHQTDLATAQEIEATGKMLRGKEGTAGGAIYFALSPRETQWKTLRRGVMFECEVKLGRMLTCDVSETTAPPYKDVQFSHLMQPKLRPANWKDMHMDDTVGDSILLSRGNDRHSGHISTGLPSGPEVVIFSWQQVQIKRMVKLPKDDAAGQPLGWYPDAIKTSVDQKEKGSITKDAFEDVFYAHTPELKVYRGLSPKDHMSAAVKLLAQKHKERLDELKQI